MRMLLHPLRRRVGRLIWNGHELCRTIYCREEAARMHKSFMWRFVENCRMQPPCCTIVDYSLVEDLCLCDTPKRGFGGPAFVAC